MVLEDVHWADPSTQDLLRSLVARPHATGVPIIVTTRVEGTDSSWVEELENSGRSQRLNLEALNRSETGELVAALAVRSPGRSTGSSIAVAAIRCSSSIWLQPKSTPAFRRRSPAC